MSSYATIFNISAFTHTPKLPHFTRNIRNNFVQWKCTNQSNFSSKSGVATALFRNKFESVQILLIQRGKSPNKGLLSLPGGRLKSNEIPFDGAIRELEEETQILRNEIHLLRDPVTAVNVPLPDSTYWHLKIFAGRYVGSKEPIAGDDAKDAAFYNVDSIQTLPIVDNLEMTISKALNAIENI